MKTSPLSRCLTGPAACLPACLPACACACVQGYTEEEWIAQISAIAQEVAGDAEPEPDADEEDGF
jgi:hypothetical protein